MRKILSVVLILSLVLSLASCKSALDKQEQTYDEGFEEIEQILVDKYGEYVLVDVAHMVNGSNEQVGIIIGLCCKDSSYTENLENREKYPPYMIVEDSRNIINQYVDEHPDSLIAQYMANEEKTVSLQFAYMNGDKMERLFSVDNTSYDNHYDKLVSYEQTSIFTGKVDKGTEYNYKYLEQMYEYIAKTGSDIVYIEILHKDGLDDKMQEMWIFDTIAKFPGMYESISEKTL